MKRTIIVLVIEKREHGFPERVGNQKTLQRSETVLKRRRAMGRKRLTTNRLN